MSAEAPIAARIAAVRERITIAAQRSGREPAHVRIVAVTKGVAPARIEEAISAGVTDVGENRVQEAWSKHEAIAIQATWHMVGHVQSNKAGRVASMFDVVHSVDGEHIATALGDRRGHDRDPIAALIEVELTGMPQRSGARAGDVEALVRSTSGRAGLRVVGLMTIAPPAQGPDAARPFFRRLRDLREQVQQATGYELPELSMGMSDDFVAAVEEGATMVRIGRAIFGGRV